MISSVLDQHGQLLLTIKRILKMRFKMDVAVVYLFYFPHCIYFFNFLIKVKQFEAPDV